MVDDPSTLQELIQWFIGVLVVSLISSITGIISIIKAGKMVPREIKGADLNNKSKEVSIADQYDILATKAAEKTLKMQDRLDKLETDYDALEDTIRRQADIIEKQNVRLDAQEQKIMEQDVEIDKLKCELNNSEQYNKALIQQMREQKLIPLEKESIQIEDCKEKVITKKREITKARKKILEERGLPNDI